MRFQVFVCITLTLLLVFNIDCLQAKSANNFSEKQRQTKTEAYTTAQRQSRAKRQFFPGYYGLGFPGFGIGNGFAFSGPFGISLGSFRGLYFG